MVFARKEMGRVRKARRKVVVEKRKKHRGGKSFKREKYLGRREVGGKGL